MKNLDDFIYHSNTLLKELKATINNNADVPLEWIVEAQILTGQLLILEKLDKLELAQVILLEDTICVN